MSSKEETQAIFRRLREPFPPEQIEWRIGRAGETNGKIWAMCLAYVTARAIQDRLDDILGGENWRVSYRFEWGSEKVDPGVMCKLEVRVNGDWIAKEDGSEQTEMESFKGGLSGAMKRAAVLFGVGRYLYDLPEGFAEIVDRGVRGSQYAKTKEGKAFHWVPPQLPDWALPKTEAPPKAVPPPKAAAPQKAEVTTAPKKAPVAAPKAEIPVAPKAAPKAAVKKAPVAKTEVKDPTRDALNRQLMAIYRPYLTAFPRTQFVELLGSRYGVVETRLMTVDQLNDLVDFMEAGLAGDALVIGPKSKGKPVSVQERGDLWNAAQANGWTKDQMTEYMRAAFGIQDSKSLNRESFQMLSSVVTKTKFETAISEFRDVP